MRGPDDERPLPLPLRAAIDGILRGGIAPSTARRMACAGTLVTAIVEGGEPVAMGRKDPPPYPRAAQGGDRARRRGVRPSRAARRTTNLEPHHILDWAWGRGDGRAGHGVAVPLGVSPEGARRGLDHHADRERRAGGAARARGGAARWSGRAHAGAGGEARRAAVEVPVRAADGGAIGIRIGVGARPRSRRSLPRPPRNLRRRSRADAHGAVHRPFERARCSGRRPPFDRCPPALPPFLAGRDNACPSRPPRATAPRTGTPAGCSRSHPPDPPPRTAPARTAASARRAKCPGGS